MEHRCILGKPLAKGYILVFFPILGGEEMIGADEGGIAVEEGCAVEFAVGRPLYDDALRRLAFALMSRLDLCAYVFGEPVHSAHSLSLDDLPESVREDCEGGVCVVHSAGDLWQR